MTAKPMARLIGRTILITGAAGGIGRATADRAVAEGANVVLTERDAGLARQISADFGDTAMGIGCDVTDAISVQAAVTAALDRFGRLDGVVHNAAAPSLDDTVVDLDLLQWHLELEVSLTGAFLLGKYAVPAMAKAGGSIVFLAS